MPLHFISERALNSIASCRVVAIGVLSLLVCLTAAVRPAPAQTDRARVFINLNGGLQNSEQGFSDNVEFTAFAEQGAFDARYPAPERPLFFDVSGGVRIWSGVAVGVGTSLARYEETADVAARIPHPFFFDRHRQISGMETGMVREERAVHLRAMWVAPLGGSVDVVLFAGPTLVEVSQDLVTEVQYGQRYPYDEANYQRAVSPGADRPGRAVTMSVPISLSTSPGGQVWD